MASEPPTPDLIQQTTETVGRFIQWIAELIRHRNWFMLLVLVGVALAILGGFFRAQINEHFLADSVEGAFWASFWTGIVLIFLGALAVAVATMPRLKQETAEDAVERKAIKGLRPFGREDAAVFAQLQREVSLRECCEAVTSDSYKFGILMGESGCGKTSFLQAGVWPKLTEANSSHRAIYIRFSEQEPFETVRKALAEQLEMPLDWLRDSTFSKLLSQAIEAAGKPTVLLLDQFEQFFVHYPRKEDRTPFINALTLWYQDRGLDSIKLLVSIRADLLHELYELHEALQYTLGPQDLFKLERFTPQEATKILAVIAETEHLEFDHRFVTELAEQELAHKERGTVSPVDLQVLAWMITRQKDDDLRAFNRIAFQKFGGVEGLLTRFLERTLDARVLENQRQSAIKTLLALTDLDRQVRAGVLTVAEIQDKLQDTAKREDVEEAVVWLSRSDVRLVTPQDKEGVRGYELAHERLIPALMRLAGNELTIADKANQLLERRVNEWLGNQRNSRYLLGWRELLLIQQQRPFLVWGVKREPKEKLIRLSQRKAYSILGSLSILLLVAGMFYVWLNFTTPGQIQQVRWALSAHIVNSSISDESTAKVANALIKDSQYAKGLKLIRNEIESRRTKASALQDVAQTAVKLAQPELLQMALAVIISIDDDNFASKSNALSAIAGAFGELDDSQRAQAVLEQALAATTSIDEPSYKFYALSAIAGAFGELDDSQRAQAVLEQALAATTSIDEPNYKSYALSAIAIAFDQLDNSQRAQAVLEQALAATTSIDEPYDKSNALSAIAGAFGELDDSQRAQAVLEQALAATTSIDEPYDKSNALSAIAGTFGELDDSQRAQIALEQALATTTSVDEPFYTDALSKISANATRALDDSQRAQDILEQALIAATSVDEPYKSEALSAIANATGELDDSQRAQVVLEQALAATTSIDESSLKSKALSAIAGAFGELDDSQRAQVVLEQALATTTSVDEPSLKSYALSAIASAASHLYPVDINQALLTQIRDVAERIGASNVLGYVASYQALYGDWHAALKTLRTCLEGDKVDALAAILTHYAESQKPQLIDGPVVLAADATEESVGQYKLSVTIQSPDRDCDRHADWWEVLSEDGELLSRYLIDIPHEFERPFTTNKKIALDPEQTVIIRAHFSDDIDNAIDQYEGDEVDKYTTQAMQGRVGQPDSFKSIRIPVKFAAQVENKGEQPGECHAN